MTRAEEIFQNTALPKEALTEHERALYDALIGVKHKYEDCWCDYAIGHPLQTSHSEACKTAQQAINKIRSRFRMEDKGND